MIIIMIMIIIIIKIVVVVMIMVKIIIIIIKIMKLIYNISKVRPSPTFEKSQNNNDNVNYLQQSLR